MTQLLVTANISKAQTKIGHKHEQSPWQGSKDQVENLSDQFYHDFTVGTSIDHPLPMKILRWKNHPKTSSNPLLLTPCQHLGGRRTSGTPRWAIGEISSGGGSGHHGGDLAW